MSKSEDFKEIFRAHTGGMGGISEEMIDYIHENCKFRFVRYTRRPCQHCAYRNTYNDKAKDNCMFGTEPRKWDPGKVKIQSRTFRD